MASRTPERNSAAPGGKPTVKQEREQRRQAKVEAFKRQQARAKRNRMFGIWSAIVGSVVAIGLVVAIVVITTVPKKDPLSIELTGLKTWDVPGAVHVDPAPVDYKADYGMDPPAGGPHWSAWLNCGI
jgi:hypothetical protein